MIATQTVTLGSIVKTVGLKGELKLLPGPDFWPEALGVDVLDLVSRDGPRRQVHVDRSRTKGKTYIIKLSGIETIDEAEPLVGDSLEVKIDGLDESTSPGKILPFQLAGVEVRLCDGRVVGKVAEVLQGPVQDCLIVENGEERLIIPNVPEVVREIDLEDGFLVIDPPDGLLDLRW